jgi:glycerophosphoryl diester phosphodiesterase
MSDLSWLTARPVAHRGYHDAAAGRIENTPGAIAAAVERGFAVEIDVHLSADGEVFAYHDAVLGRLTEGTGPVSALTMQALREVPFKATSDRIPSLRDVLDIMGERTPLVVEVKSHFKARQRDLVEAVARVLADYRGPVAVMSFDPRMVEDFSIVAPGLTRGIVADAAHDPHEYGDFTPAERAELASLGHIARSKPQFVGYWVRLLPNDVSRRVREELKLPLLTWTVRTPQDRAAATAHADQMIFEGFDPEI